MQIKTHELADKKLLGEPLSIEDDKSSEVVLKITKEMTVDEKRLIHGGFTFSLADYAAMLAVNHPNVVLGSADVKFIKPVVVGDTLKALATVVEIEDKKRIVKVDVFNQKNEIVFSGNFICFVLQRHVLDK